MAWTVVVLLVTSGYGGVLVSSLDGVQYPSILSKTMFLKPSDGDMNINIIANDSYGRVGVRVTLENKCFQSDSDGWEFSQVQVTKKSHEQFHFNLSVGVCEITCTKKWDRGNRKAMLQDIRVISDGLFKCGETPPNPHEDEATNVENIDVKDCSDTKPRQTCTCPCESPTSALPSTTRTSAPPSHASPDSTALPSSSGSTATQADAATGKRFSTMAKVLMVVEAVEVLATCVMGIVVVVVIRRSSRRAAAIIKRRPVDELHGDRNFSHEQSRGNATKGDNGQK